MTITEFLLARIADDEAQARIDMGAAMAGYAWKDYPKDAYDELQRFVLAAAKRKRDECAAKRAIVEMWSNGAKYPDFEGGYESAIDGVLEHLAAVYADHPDYREEWRP